MAVLEAFVYDPLLNWRLIDSEYHLFVYLNACTAYSFSNILENTLYIFCWYMSVCVHVYVQSWTLYITYVMCRVILCS